MRHFYYGQPHKLDLSKYREHATALAQGETIGDRVTKPETVVIHFHRYEAGRGCPTNTVHEIYTFDEETQNVKIEKTSEPKWGK